LIESHLVERCLHEGYEVRVLDNFETGRRENVLHVARDIELSGDIQGYERAHRAIKGCEVALHQAALPSVPRSIEDPLASNASNVTGTLSVLSAARDNEASRVAYACLSSLLGKTLRCQSTKPAGRRREILSQLHQVLGLTTVSLRYFDVFGPRQDRSHSTRQSFPTSLRAVSQDGGPPFTGTASSREILRT
jgi:nucleoside-diphosphate-sugar epimerase